ncbi:MAG: hypothetical protein ACLGHQ_15910 [Acidimicrobiia bacterium]
MDSKTLGLAGLRGWRSSVANAAARPVARRSPLSEDQVRAVIGALFLALSVLYVVGAVRDVVRER